MIMKEMDVLDIVKHSFDWARKPELKRLFGVFFAGNLFPILSLGILLCVLASIATYILLSGTLLSFLMNEILLFMVGAAITLIITGAFAYYALSRFGWTKDKDFVSLALKLFKIRFGLYVITLVLVSLTLCVVLGMFRQALIGEELDFLVSALPSIPFLFGAVIVLVLLVAIGLLEGFWIYINNFFLMGKILELGGKKNEFTQISVENYIKYLKFELIRLFTICFNWINSKILAAQVILLALTLIMLVLTITPNTTMLNAVEKITFLLLAIASGMLYSVLVAYCSIRLYVATPIRILESKNSKNTMKMTWGKMGGHTLNAFFTLILLMLALFVVGLAGFVLETISQLPMQISMSFTPLLILTLPLYVFVVILLRSMMGNMTIFMTMLTILNFYGKLKETGKKEAKAIAKKPKPKKR